MNRRLRLAGLLWLVALHALGCSPVIGDACQSSADCSLNGDRVCDRSQPKGYCTVRNCDGETCPEGARCVEWRGQPARTAERWCMAACSSQGDCREGDGYRCVHAEDVLSDGTPIAEVIDEGKASARFCAATALP